MAKLQQGRMNSERGQTIVFLALAMIVGGMFLGFAVDGARSYFMKARLAKIVDAATLAGAKALAVSSDDATGIANATTAACDSARVNGFTAEGGPGTCPGNIAVSVAPNASGRMQVTVTGTDSDKTTLLNLGTMMGCGSVCENISVAALAAAEFASVLTAPVVPLAIRAVNFGPVDPDISGWSNPDKIGPSGPDVCYGQYSGEACADDAFTPDSNPDVEDGDIIYLGSYGKGTNSGVSLVLDYLHTANPDGDVENYIQVLKGNRDPLPMSIGETYYVVQEGRTNHATHIDDRLHQNADPALTRVIIPIVATLEEYNKNPSMCPDVANLGLSFEGQCSREGCLSGENGEYGDLSGKVLICDFITVEILGTEDVPDGTPDEPGYGDKAKHLYGRVVKEAIAGPAGLGSTNVSDPSVVTPYLML